MPMELIAASSRVCVSSSFVEPIANRETYDRIKGYYVVKDSGSSKTAQQGQDPESLSMYIDRQEINIRENNGDYNGDGLILMVKDARMDPYRRILRGHDQRDSTATVNSNAGAQHGGGGQCVPLTRMPFSIASGMSSLPKSRAFLLPSSSLASASLRKLQGRWDYTGRVVGGGVTGQSFCMCM